MSAQKISSYIIIVFLSVFSGCSTDFAGKDNNRPASLKDIKAGLDDIELVYEGMNYDKVMARYQDNVPAGASVTRFGYFIVFSNIDSTLTYRLVDTDIRQTTETMVSYYVSDKPDSVTPVFLFSDFEPYKDFSVNFLGVDASDLSPYGFYKISKNVIVIRYVSWKGSIAHEITHSFIQHDFPEAPSWFDEGFASLHEKADFSGGILKGTFSWRIIALRRALKENTYTGLKTMMKTNDEELYGKRSSFYYAQSRYLLMFLQEKGLLDDYYRLFRENFLKDKTGISQLEDVTGMTIAELDKEYMIYVKSFE